MLLRIQHERQATTHFPSLGEYTACSASTRPGSWLNPKPSSCIRPDHRESRSTATGDGPRSVILEQVSNGIAIRMAVLYLCAGGQPGNIETAKPSFTFLLPLFTFPLMPALWIANARVIDRPPARRRGDLFVRDGRIVPSLSGPIKNARRRSMPGPGGLPGLVDIHVHFRNRARPTRKPSHRLRAAAAGGFTTVVCMPNTSPPADNAGTIQFIKDASCATRSSRLPTGCITVGMKGRPRPIAP